MPSLSVKNEEAYRLAKELADLEGETMTNVVVEALRDRLESKRKPQIDDERMRYILDLGRNAREEIDPDGLAADLHDREPVPPT